MAIGEANDDGQQINDDRDEPNPLQKPGENGMQLRFRVNQAEAFRQGINVPKSIVTVEVDAAVIPEEERNLLADRMDGIDVCEGVLDNDGQVRPNSGDYAITGKPVLIQAILPTYEGLIEAVRKDDERLRILWQSPRARARRSLQKFQAEHGGFTFMSEQEPPTPSQNYKALQQQLVKAIAVKQFQDGKSPHSDWDEIDRLRPLLTREFEQAFNFKITNRFPGGRKRDTLNLLREVLCAEGHGGSDFDHVDYATRAGFDGEILISQPYGVATEVHQRLAAKFGYTFTQADEWTYHYPGKSHLFIVAVTRDAIRQLRKQSGSKDGVRLNN